MTSVASSHPRTSPRPLQLWKSSTAAETYARAQTQIIRLFAISVSPDLRNVTPKIAARQIAGDTWLWVAIDAETKLVPSWHIGQRDAIAVTDFIAVSRAE